MKVAQLHDLTPEQFLNQKYPIRAPKVKKTQRLSQNQMSELKETIKVKVVALYEYTPKLFSMNCEYHNVVAEVNYLSHCTVISVCKHRQIYRGTKKFWK